MRKLAWLAVLAAALWSGYWYAGARGIERGLALWLEARRAEGWQAEAAGIETAGFPFAFETTVTGIALVDPETGLGWEAPEFRFGAPAHAPTRAHAYWPQTQLLLTPRERIDIAASEMHAALGLVPGPRFMLDNVELALSDVVLASSAGWRASLGTGSLMTARTDEDPLAHDIRFTAQDVVPARFVLLALDPTGRLPEEIAEMDLDLRAGFDAPWDRQAVEARRPQPVRLDLRRLKLLWGAMQIEAAGSVTVDANGVPEGSITVRAVNWREMLEIAAGAGWVPAELVPGIEEGLSLLAGLTGNPRTIDAPLSFRNGIVAIGPVPLGPAPVLKIR